MMQDVLPPGTLLRNGTIRIEYPLGRGGFGITYLATHLIYKQPVAVKEFFLKDISVRDTRSGNVEVGLTEQESFKTGLRKFLREGQILAKLNFPGIVQVRDLFAERGTAYLVMEYLKGETLKARMARAAAPAEPRTTTTRLAPLPEPEVRRIMMALVESLGAIHAQGICHLDIKPGNIILEPDGRIVLIDFGASRQGVTGANHAVSIMAYTPSYAPPELQGANPSFGPESDIYQIAILLHEMLTGDLPPPAERRANLRPAWQPQNVPQPYRTMIGNALLIDRAHRPQNIRTWWASANSPRPSDNKGPLMLVSGAMAAAFAAVFITFLINPKLLENLTGKAPGPTLSAAVVAPSTAPVQPMAVLCAETGALARADCPTKEVPVEQAKGKGLCEKHALRCKECGHIWSLKLPEGMTRRYCTDDKHKPEPGEKEDPRFIEEVLKLVEIPPVKQPEGVIP